MKTYAELLRAAESSIREVEHYDYPQMGVNELTWVVGQGLHAIACILLAQEKRIAEEGERHEP